MLLEAGLAMEKMQELQSNLEKKVNPSILKDYFSSRTDPSIFTFTEPFLLDRSNNLIDHNKMIIRNEASM